MSEDPFAVEEREGVLQLFLDTPGSEINVFTERAASQLRAILSGVDAARQRAVVFRTRKPRSFINGASLMLANSVQRPEDLEHLTAPIRTAYRAIRNLAVPSIAAVQGNCFGCGLEFTLHATHRVAERTYDTQFYMTEIADYLLVPTFGATQDLPPLVGLEHATDLLLWGQRWSADEAFQKGLVDACFDPSEFEAQLQAFVAGVLAGSPKARGKAPVSDKELGMRTRARIARLPPAYRSLYTDCFGLLEKAAGATPGGSDAYAQEMAACGRSLTAPIAKAAVAFFFIRQIAQARSSDQSTQDQIARVSVEGLPELAQLFTRRAHGIEVVTHAGGADALRLIGDGAPASSRAVAVRVTPVDVPPAWNVAALVYAPLLEWGVELVEVAAPTACLERDRAVALFQRARFHVIPTTVRQKLILDGLFEAYFAPLQAFVRQGGSPADVVVSLRDFGFVLNPAELAARLKGRCDELLGVDAAGGSPHAELVDALLLSLLGFAVEALAERRLEHVTFVDVAARKALDFPLGLTSLCRYVDCARAGTLLERSSSFTELLPPRSLELAQRYVAVGRSFYR